MPSSTQKCPTQHASVGIAIIKHPPPTCEKYLFQFYSNILFLRTHREMKIEFFDIQIYLMPPSHCCEFCLRTNTNWHSLRITQHRIDSNYFVLVRCHFRISSQANTNVLKCSKHSYWPYESKPIRRTSYQFMSVPIASYLIIVHSYRFVVHSH